MRKRTYIPVSLSADTMITWQGLQTIIGRYSLAGQFVEDKVVLDVACGIGYGSNYLLRKGARVVVGGDLSGESIEYATNSYRKEGLHYLHLDAQQLPLADNSVDVIVSMETIEHLSEYKRFLVECKRVLGQRGMLVCSTPNKATISPDTEMPVNPYHVQEFTITEFHSLIRDYFDDVTMYGLNPYGKRARTMAKLAQIKTRFNTSRILKLANILFKVCFRRFRFVKLQDIDEANFDAMLDERSTPFLLKDDSPPPISIIAVARSTTTSEMRDINKL